MITCQGPARWSSCGAGDLGYSPGMPLPASRWCCGKPAPWTRRLRGMSAGRSHRRAA